MDNLRAVIKNLFCYISPQDILKGIITYDNISQETFDRLGRGYIDWYSIDEINNMYAFLENEFKWQNHRLKSDTPVESKTGRLNTFDALMVFNFNVLVEEESAPVCQFSHLLRWRDMVITLDEDLFTTSFLAQKDMLKLTESRHNFFWKPVIGHNNYALNKLVSKGVAENHFHMKGSSPSFYLSWISMMNDVQNGKFKRCLEEYDTDKLLTKLNYRTSAEESYVFMWKRAALIRLFLFTKLRDQYIDFGQTYVYAREFLMYVEKEKKQNFYDRLMENKESLEGKISLDDYRSFIDDNGYIEMKKKYSEDMVGRMLQDYDLLEQYLSVIQQNIAKMRAICGKAIADDETSRIYDYTICEGWLARNGDKRKNEILSGERWFLYEMFCKVYGEENSWSKYINWFYLYLVLKENIRLEIIQANKTYGFSNFAKYQDRKDNFIEGTIYEEPYIRMAVRDTILNQHLVSLEARISPKIPGAELRKTIQKYDGWICNGLSEDEEEKLKDQYFYVVHFIKDVDKGDEYGCRHSVKRQQVKEQALAIAQMRDNMWEECKRIHGIDASASEIGCRPEVFGHAFRFLKNHECGQKYAEGLIFNGTWKVQKLMATYHVGEDFLDIIDGLRAIDEAICFLELRCGDRIGHALALGVDIDEWYHLKSYRILLPKQDYLDNLVWLYSMIRKYGIQGCEDAEIFIEKRFEQYFEEIYGRNINQELISYVEEGNKRFCKERDVQRNYYHMGVWNFGINDYFDAWKLRGDDPCLYQKGFFAAEKTDLDDWEYYGVNREFPRNYQVRYKPKAAFLYYLYHFDANVKKIGREVTEIKVNKSIVKAIKEVQRRMQVEIANLGIGIESNPSSNYLIGTFRRYDKHPIIGWHNEVLVKDPMLLERSPQLQVSINTDDQGVFATYIENEYAYLALALEKACDKEGRPLYKRNDILHWLDNVRCMGIDQSFAETIVESLNHEQSKALFEKKSFSVDNKCKKSI